MYTYRRDPLDESFTSSLEKVLLLIGNLVLSKNLIRTLLFFKHTHSTECYYYTNKKNSWTASFGVKEGEKASTLEERKETTFSF